VSCGLAHHLTYLPVSFYGGTPVVRWNFRNGVQEKAPEISIVLPYWRMGMRTISTVGGRLRTFVRRMEFNDWLKECITLYFFFTLTDLKNVLLHIFFVKVKFQFYYQVSNRLYIEISLNMSLHGEIPTGIDKHSKRCKCNGRSTWKVNNLLNVIIIPHKHMQSQV
jgi:hypothetical protein